MGIYTFTFIYFCVEGGGAQHTPRTHMEVRGQTVRVCSFLSNVWVPGIELRLGRCPSLLSHLADPIRVFYELDMMAHVLEGREAGETGA